MPSLKRRADNTDDSASRKRHNTRRTATAEPEQQPEESNPMEVPIRGGSVSEPVAAETAPTNDEHVKTLKLLHDDFDVLRQTLTCRICEKLFYEPYVLHCGHTYCYRCLSTWFNSNAKMSCPNCRVRITQIPAPSYAIKDMVIVFMKRAELLPDGETVQEHETWRKEEEEHLAADKNNTDPRVGGLFKGRFNGRRGVLRPLVDPSDNVARCPSCHWELEDDSCPNCGLHFDSEGFESGSDDYDSLDDPDDMDGDIDAADDDGSAWGWGADLDRMDGIGGHSDASNSDYGGDAAFQMDMRGYNVREQVQNAMQNLNQANARRLYAAMGNPNHHRPHAFHNNGWPVVPAGVRNLNHEDDHDEQEDEEEDDDEDAGSMDGFVVNDNESEVAASHRSISSDDDDTERPRVGARRRVPAEDESERHFPWATAPSRRSRRVVESSDDSSDDSDSSDSNSDDSSDSDSTPGNSQRNPEVLDGSSSDSESDSVDSERHYHGQPLQHMSSSTADDSDDEPPRPAVPTRRMNQAQSQRRRQPQFQSAGRLNPRTNVARSGRQRNDQGVIDLASP